MGTLVILIITAVAMMYYGRQVVVEIEARPVPIISSHHSAEAWEPSNRIEIGDCFFTLKHNALECGEGLAHVLHFVIKPFSDCKGFKEPKCFHSSITISLMTKKNEFSKTGRLVIPEVKGMKKLKGFILTKSDAITQMKTDSFELNTTDCDYSEPVEVADLVNEMFIHYTTDLSWSVDGSRPLKRCSKFTTWNGTKIFDVEPCHYEKGVSPREIFGKITLIGLLPRIDTFSKRATCKCSSSSMHP